MPTRRNFTRLIAASPLAIALPARAHHGYMRWDEDNPIAIEGWVSKEMDGFPHWEIHVRVDGVDWEVDLGDQWQLRKAGLREDGGNFSVGRKIVVEGIRPIDRKILRMLPRRIVLDGEEEYTMDVQG